MIHNLKYSQQQRKYDICFKKPTNAGAISITSLIADSAYSSLQLSCTNGA